MIERLRQEARSSEVEFRSIDDPAEIVRIAISYIARLDAEEVRMSRVGDFIWLLLKNRGTTINVTFRLQQETPPAEEAAEPYAAGLADFTPKSRRDLWQNGAFSAVSSPAS